MNFNPLGSVRKLEGVVCLLIVAGCWGNRANQLQQPATHVM